MASRIASTYVVFFILAVLPVAAQSQPPIGLPSAAMDGVEVTAEPGTVATDLGARPHHRFALRSSLLISASRRIFDRRPGPMLSPVWAGTTVA